MNPVTVQVLMLAARNYCRHWAGFGHEAEAKERAAEGKLRDAIEAALADAYDTGMRKGSVWGLAKGQPQPELVGWLDALHAVFRANPNWQWQKGPTTLSASIPVFLHPAPEAQPDFCCEASWRDAKVLAWKGRNLDCGCDHNQSCLKCYPVDFRVGGKFDKFAAGKP